MRRVPPAQQKGAEMGVLTRIHRLSPDALEKIRLDTSLIDCLRHPEQRSPRELGYDSLPPWLSLDKSWDDLLRLLSGCGYAQASRALQEVFTLRYRSSDVWVRCAAAPQVQETARLLREVRREGLGERAVQLSVRDDNGRVLQGTALAYVLGHLGGLIEFMDEAASAGEAVLLYSS
jgi:hypothetical protein